MLIGCYVILQYEGLIVVKKQQFEICNIEELSALADFKQDYLQPRPSLPTEVH